MTPRSLKSPAWKWWFWTIYSKLRVAQKKRKSPFSVPLTSAGEVPASLLSMNLEGWVDGPRWSLQNRRFMESVVEQLRPSLKVEQKVPIARVADFRIAKELSAERAPVTPSTQRKPDKSR